MNHSLFYLIINSIDFGKPKRMIQGPTNDDLDSNIWTNFRNTFTVDEKIGEGGKFFWNQKQNTLYADFIEKNQEVLGNSRLKRVCKIFKVMSEWMKQNGSEKSSEQCRGHHKKFLSKYGSILQVVKEIRSRKQDGSSKVQIRSLSRNEEIIPEKIEDNIFEVSEVSACKLDGFILSFDLENTGRSSSEITQI